MVTSMVPHATRESHRALMTLSHGTGSRSVQCAEIKIDSSVWKVAIVAVIGPFMTQVDSTVVNVAAPPIARDFHASSAGLEWILSGYPLAISVGLILGGRLGDLYGRRQMFLIGTTSYSLRSVLLKIVASSTECPLEN